MPIGLMAHTSNAGFHQGSTRMTLLQHVRFRPVLPALHEMRITRVLALALILRSASSRSGFDIEPSSAARQRAACWGVEKGTYSGRT